VSVLRPSHGGQPQPEPEGHHDDHDHDDQTQARMILRPGLVFKFFKLHSGWQSRSRLNLKLHFNWKFHLNLPLIGMTPIWQFLRCFKLDSSSALTVTESLQVAEHPQRLAHFKHCCGDSLRPRLVLLRRDQ
jgi:hypothetical protein